MTNLEQRARSSRVLFSSISLPEPLQSVKPSFSMLQKQVKIYRESHNSSPFTHIPLQISSIEFSQIEVSVMHGLAQGNEALKSIHKELSIENVEKLMEESAGAQSYQRVSISFSLLLISSSP